MRSHWGRAIASSGHHFWCERKLFVTVSANKLVIHILPRYIIKIRYFLIGELHRTRDHYKSGHHSWSECQFFFTVVDVYVSLFSANDSVKYTLWYISCPDNSTGITNRPNRLLGRVPFCTKSVCSKDDCIFLCWEVLQVVINNTGISETALSPFLRNI